MDAMTTPVSTEALAERRRLGLDVFDEVWDGVLHMVPAPSGEHQRLATHLGFALLPIAAPLGLQVLIEPGLFDPAVPGHHDYRRPDLTVHEPRLLGERGVEGPAHLVVEIASPGDESLAKLGFFARLGVREVVIIDRDTKAIRRWVNDGVGHLSETPPDRDGRHRLACLPVDLWSEAGTLMVGSGGTDTPI